jgi:hypothetical protein
MQAIENNQVKFLILFVTTASEESQVNIMRKLSFKLVLAILVSTTALADQRQPETRLSLSDLISSTSAAKDRVQIDQRPRLALDELISCTVPCERCDGTELDLAQTRTPPISQRTAAFNASSTAASE